MGIKGLNKFLSEKNLVKTYHIDNYVQEKEIYVAIDGFLQLYKYLISNKNFLVSCMIHINRLLKNNIIPIYVLDGCPPDAKNNIINNRNNKRQKTIKLINELEEMISVQTNEDEINKILENINTKKKQTIRINKKHINELCELLDSIGIKYLHAKGEADVLCAELNKHKYVDACYSDDMDLLVFGCKKLIKLTNYHVYEYDIDFILQSLNITFDQFQNMCILFGCDYYKSPLKNTSNQIYEIIKNNDDYITEELIEVKEIFNNSYSIENINYNINNIRNKKFIDIYKINSVIRAYNYNNDIKSKEIFKYVNGYLDNDIISILKIY